MLPDAPPAEYTHQPPCGRSPASERLPAHSPHRRASGVELGEFCASAISGRIVEFARDRPGDADHPLERRLFAPAGYNPPQSRPLTDRAYVHAELRRHGVTLALLRQDYRGQHPDGYGYSRYCDLYGEWRRGVTATMCQTHVAGEKLSVDFAGDTVTMFDGLTGEARNAKIFVAVLGASNYTYAEARFSEALPDWIGVHVNALAFLVGVPKTIVCDNLKAEVTAASATIKKVIGSAMGRRKLLSGLKADKRARAAVLSPGVME